MDLAQAVFLKYKALGCTSCLVCQKDKEYGCVIDDGARSVLLQMLESDAIVMATPFYYFGPMAQLKIIFDFLFSLYKSNHEVNIMETPLQGKVFALLAIAFEDRGFGSAARTFSINR